MRISDWSSDVCSSDLYQGRSFTLEQPRLVGCSSDADIRIDDPSFADWQARLDLLGDDIILRDLCSAEGTLVNGEPMRDALLRAGDRVGFEARMGEVRVGEGCGSWGRLVWALGIF